MARPHGVHPALPASCEQILLWLSNLAKRMECARLLALWEALGVRESVLHSHLAAIRKRHQSGALHTLRDFQASFRFHVAWPSTRRALELMVVVHSFLRAVESGGPTVAPGSQRCLMVKESIELFRH